MATPRIILAEDDEGWRELLTAWIASKGYRFEIFPSGAGILERGRESPPDGFILDYELGDTTGGELCARIKGDPALRAIPVILFTSSAHMLMTLPEGAMPDHFVVKNVDPSELFAVLEALCPATPGSSEWADPQA